MAPVARLGPPQSWREAPLSTTRYDKLVLLMPIIFATCGVPWASIALAHVAATCYMWRFAFHEYAPDEIGELNWFSTNLKMACFFVSPHVASLALAYLRRRSSLQLAAMVMQERANSRTLRELYEAAQLEAPEPPEQPSSAGGRSKTAADEMASPLML